MPQDQESDKMNFANVASTPGDYGSNCEWVLTSKTTTPVRQEAYDAFYQLMITYRYPMRYLTQNQNKIAALSSAEQDLLSADELGFIRNRFASSYPQYAEEVNIATFPKSLYQLIAYVESFNTQEKRLKFQWENEDDGCSFEDYCFKVLSESSDNHYQVNVKINDFKQEIQATIPHGAQALKVDDEVQLYIQFAVDALRKVNDPFGILTNQYLLDTHRQAENLHVLQDLISLEWQSRLKQNINFVYQGKGQQIHNRRYSNNGYSDSFSDGVFGGGCYDADNGMAFAYMAGKKGAHIIDIIEIHKELNPTREYHIYTPRVTTLINLHGCGEFHHARSKISGSEYNFRSHPGIAPLHDALNKSKLSFLLAPRNLGNAATHEDLIDFLKQNAIELLANQHYTKRRTFNPSEQQQRKADKKQDFSKVHSDIVSKIKIKK